MGQLKTIPPPEPSIKWFKKSKGSKKLQINVLTTFLKGMDLIKPRVEPVDHGMSWLFVFG